MVVMASSADCEAGSFAHDLLMRWAPVQVFSFHPCPENTAGIRLNLPPPPHPPPPSPLSPRRVPAQHAPLHAAWLPRLCQPRDRALRARAAAAWPRQGIVQNTTRIGSRQLPGRVKVLSDYTIRQCKAGACSLCAEERYRTPLESGSADLPAYLPLRRRRPAALPLRHRCAAAARCPPTIPGGEQGEGAPAGRGAARVPGRGRARGRRARGTAGRGSARQGAL
jgi:hypothetical protein